MKNFKKLNGRTYITVNGQILYERGFYYLVNRDGVDAVQINNNKIVLHAKHYNKVWLGYTMKQRISINELAQAFLMNVRFPDVTVDEMITKKIKKYCK